VPHVAVKVPEPQKEALKLLELPLTTGVAGVGFTITETVCAELEQLLEVVI
jgi:hypothetical protein